jgi:sugar lactone lactonase YvrE
VDAKGRAYVSCTGFNILEQEKPCRGSIVRVDPDGTASIACADLDYPNGLIVTPDGSELIVAETFGARLKAFTVGPGGELTDPRVWAQVGTAPQWDSIDTLVQTDFAPDGCAIDEDGIWVADAINARVLKIAEGGRIIDEVASPQGLGIYACALGGVSGRELLMCLAPSFDLTHCLSNRDAVLHVETVRAPIPAA